MFTYMFILMAVATLLLLQISARLRRIAQSLERNMLAETVLPWRTPQLAQRPDESDAQYKARATEHWALHGLQ